jgi:membrane-associated phospholipid phosphatase
VSAVADTPIEQPAAARPWKRAALWLSGLAPFFYLTYGAANWLTTLRPSVPAVVFDWERHIPFLGWTIVPYWSINLFYAASLFVCTSASELDRHGRRLLTAQVVAVACFLLAPLRFTFAKPETSGLSGFLFDALLSFDRPYNQAPSLHIALLVILWTLYARHVPRRFRPTLHVWFTLIGLSVLTTFQHHFVDVPTGALLGFACLWAWPDSGGSPFPARFTGDPRRRALAVRYAFGAAAVAAVALASGGVALWLLWASLSLALVAAAYACFGTHAFQKDSSGRMSLAARVLLAPYQLGAFVNSRLWTRCEPGLAAVADGVYLGRLPAGGDRGLLPGATLVDATAELPSPDGFLPARAFPMLDLVTPQAATLRAAAAAVERARRVGPVLVACALGYSRSAAVVATWLLATGRAGSVEEAVAAIRAVRPRIVLDDRAKAAIAAGATR